jgi:L-amino acid N-acyltransferase YncA
MYIFRKATPEDLNKVLEILDSVLLSKMTSRKNGFLTFNPGKEFYQDLINKTKFFYVAQDKKKIVGFLIAVPSGLLNPIDEIQKFFIDNYKKEKFVYIFQIAVSPEQQTKGVGRGLYKKLFADTKSIKKMVVTSAVPHNQASEKFHLKLGFKKIGKLVRSDGGESFIYENTEAEIR